MNHKKIAIIIVNYKDYAKKFLAECRNSIRDQNYPKELYKVYIIDNASTEQSAKYLKVLYPEAKIIPRRDGNYSKANNTGIEEGIKDGCEYFVIANMDTRFDSSWLSELMLAIDEYDNIGIVQSKILLYPKGGFKEKQKPSPNTKSFGLLYTEEKPKNLKINSVGNALHFLGHGFSIGYGDKDCTIEGLPEIEGYASGCSFVIKKKVIEAIGGYNEDYYMYHDDTEISLKARLAGYKIILSPKSIVYHKYDFTRSTKSMYYMERNRYLVMLHFYKVPTILVLLPMIIILDVAELLFSLTNGWFKEKLNVYIYFLKFETWKNIAKTRGQIKKLKKIKDSELLKEAVGSIVFQEVSGLILKYIGNPIMNAYWFLAKKIIKW